MGSTIISGAAIDQLQIPFGQITQSFPAEVELLDLLVHLTSPFVSLTVDRLEVVAVKSLIRPLRSTASVGR